MKRLFIDDIRKPSNCCSYVEDDRKEMYKEQWEIVRSYDEFREWILANGLPDVISLDHDLSTEHILLCDAQYTNWDEYYQERDREMTGYDCAKWLVEFCQYECLPLPEWYVHSMNPAGRKNIEEYLENFKLSQEKIVIDIDVQDKNQEKEDEADIQGLLQQKKEV